VGELQALPSKPYGLPRPTARTWLSDVNLEGGTQGIDLARELRDRHDTTCVFLTAQPEKVHDAEPVATGRLQPRRPRALPLTSGCAGPRDAVPTVAARSARSRPIRQGALEIGLRVTRQWGEGHAPGGQHLRD
jgi:CheY-like chemotaxis protein